MKTGSNILFLFTIAFLAYPFFRGCSEQAVFPYNTPPSVKIISPSDEEVFYSGEEVYFSGRVYDSSNPLNELTIEWTSSIDSSLDTQTPGSSGETTLKLSNLSVATHTITLKATDPELAVGEDSINIDVIINTPPSCEIVTPSMNSLFYSGEMITFTGIVEDPDQRYDTLSIVWESDLAGELLSAHPDRSGETSFSTILEETGSHEIVLAVYDEAGGACTDVTIIEVAPPSDIDNDGDGYSIDEGDCNDSDPTTFPGAPELDDCMDNDCDGNIEENIPVPSITVPSESYSCTAITLDGSGSYDLCGGTLDFHWEITAVPAGSQVEIGDGAFDDPTSPSPLFYPDLPGDYRVSLTVTTGESISASASLTVQVLPRGYNSPPTAFAGSDVTVSNTASCTTDGYVYICSNCADYTVALDGSGSSDPDSDLLTYQWAVYQGGGEIIDNEASSTEVIIPGPATSYGETTTSTTVISLTVTDCMDESSSDYINIYYECQGI